jgi:uncharacterized phosphosugar-binding protein
MLERIRRRQRIFIFGTGHSHMLAEEAFYRAGGLAAIVPVFSSALMLHEHPELGGRLERTPGLAERLLDSYHPQPAEMIFIVSNSGVNYLPVEMALTAKARGLLVVSISSFEYALVAPLSALGRRLDEIADLAIDNGCPPGDALAPIEGTPWRVGPGSTVMTALIWNCLATEVAYRMQSNGLTPPIFVSLNLPGANQHNESLLAEWRPGNPHF